MKNKIGMILMGLHGPALINTKYSTHGAYIEYDILNFSMHISTSNQTKYLSTCAVVHTEIEIIILNIGAVH